MYYKIETLKGKKNWFREYIWNRYKSHTHEFKFIYLWVYIFIYIFMSIINNKITHIYIYEYKFV